MSSVRSRRDVHAAGLADAEREGIATGFEADRVRAFHEGSVTEVRDAWIGIDGREDRHAARRPWEEV